MRPSRNRGAASPSVTSCRSIATIPRMKCSFRPRSRPRGTARGRAQFRRTRRWSRGAPRLHPAHADHPLSREVPVALHAGELWLGLVPPPDLAFHIREAIEIAGARRIGHGVALAFERYMEGLLAEMRTRPVVVEVCLTSTDLILGVRGKDHPLPAYLAAGVPVVLSS